MEKKDYFSDQSQAYAAFRPVYPDDLYRFIFEHVSARSCAWDCGTGNGQVARHLAAHFKTVHATDISQQQLDRAFRAKNIIYSLAAAERTPFEDDQFDLITVAQALHWFDLPSFYGEVTRTAKAGGVLAVWGYALLTVDRRIDELFLDFYKNTVGPYWDPARKLIDNHYRGIPFPFHEIPCPDFEIRVSWTRDEFAGYLRSWSAVQNYIGAKSVNPVVPFIEGLQHLWKGNEKKTVTFPLFTRLAKIK